MPHQPRTKRSRQWNHAWRRCIGCSTGVIAPWALSSKPYRIQIYYVKGVVCIQECICVWSSKRGAGEWQCQETQFCEKLLFRLARGRFWCYSNKLGTWQGVFFQFLSLDEFVSSKERFVVLYSLKNEIWTWIINFVTSTQQTWLSYL